MEVFYDNKSREYIRIIYLLYSVPCKEGSLRHFSHNSSRHMVIEICHNGKYSTVCANSWTQLEAKVVCAELGFSPLGKHTEELFLNVLS